jgi:hypothetical protein
MITAAIEKRLASLEFAAKHGKRGKQSVVEDMRQMLESVDGQVDLDMRPGENLFTVFLRRVQGQDGWTLAGISGDTLNDKVKTIDAACRGKAVVSDEARHAARKLFAMYEAI